MIRIKNMKNIPGRKNMKTHILGRKKHVQGGLQGQIKTPIWHQSSQGPKNTKKMDPRETRRRDLHFGWLCNAFLTIALRIEGLMVSLLQNENESVINTQSNLQLWVQLLKKHYKVIQNELGQNHQKAIVKLRFAPRSSNTHMFWTALGPLQKRACGLSKMKVFV